MDKAWSVSWEGLKPLNFQHLLKYLNYQKRQRIRHIAYYHSLSLLTLPCNYNDL